jgi:hypothetical protein
VQLSGVGLRQLQTLLEALATLAPKVEYPAVPEMRITDAERQFLVQVREGQVRFSSWSVRAGGCDLTPAQIVAAITGADPSTTAAGGEAEPAPPSRRRRGWQVVLLVGGILGSNAITAWMLTRPGPALPVELQPPYRLVESEPAERLLTRAAGVFETGGEEGDRRLAIRRDGAVNWGRYGPNRLIVEETPLTVVAAETDGQPALRAGDHSLIVVKDAATVVYFGDTYRRVPP